MIRMFLYIKSYSIIIATVLLTFIIIPIDANSDIYKYADKQGTIHLTNTKCASEEYDTKDFLGSQKIDSICTLLKKDIAFLRKDETPCSIKWLNNLISQPSLYQQIINDEQIKANKTIKRNKTIMDLYNFTESLKFDESSKDTVKRNCINTLNRLVLEAVYQKEIPKIQTKFVLVLKEKPIKPKRSKMKTGKSRPFYEGAWENSEGTKIYNFSSNNELIITYHKSVNDSAKEKSGLWRTGHGICWDTRNNEMKGNMILYIDNLQCCLSVEVLSGSLVFTDIWQKGSDDIGVCKNQILRRISYDK